MNKIIVLMVIGIFLASPVMAAVHSSVSTPAGLRTEVQADLGIVPEDIKIQSKVQLRSGREAIIKFLPETASVIAVERLNLKFCTEENDCIVELREVGENLVYKVTAQKKYNFLGFIPFEGQVLAEINAETGEVERIQRPLLAFLSTEVD